MADRELRDYFTSEEANRALEDIILTYGDRLNSILLQDYETRLKREVERQVEGQQLTLKFPDLIGQRVVRRNSIWFEVHAEPKIEYVKRSAVSGLFKKRTR